MNCHPDRSAAKWRDLLFGQSALKGTWKRRPFLCHPERSRGICSSADPSWKHRLVIHKQNCHLDRWIMGLWPTQGDEENLGPATTFYRTVALSFVIPTGAKRSGGTCGSADPSWKHRLLIPHSP